MRRRAVESPSPPYCGPVRAGSAPAGSHGQALFYCATQLVPYQRMQILGAAGRIEIEIPLNAPPDRPCRIFVDDGSERPEAPAAVRPAAALQA